MITQAEYDERVHAIVLAIRNLLREPDVIAVQEVAVFADGANALTGLAQALGNYTAYIATNNDGRGIATGFLVKTGTTATGGERDRRRAPEPVGQLGRVRPAPGPAVRPRAVQARPQEGRHVLRRAEQPLRVAVAPERRAAISEADYVRQQAAALQQQGKNVLVAGDLNDFEFSPPLATLTQGNVLTNLWDERPAGLAYSYKFNGHLQTLDHILVTAGLKSRVTDMRYVHFDNDVYERSPTDGTGISDHDPPVVTFELAARARASRARLRHRPRRRSR